MDGDTDGRNGDVRHIAKYRDIRGRKQSAGTYSNQREADKAWQKAEVKIAEGRVGDPRRGRQSFQRYVEQEWLPNHVMEPSTREGYTYQIGKHIMPWFGHMKMVEILPSHVREWVTYLRQQRVSPKTIQNLRNILSAIFTTALNDQVTFLHPCKGVKTPTVPVKPPTIISPAVNGTCGAPAPVAAAWCSWKSGGRWSAPAADEFGGRCLSVCVSDADTAATSVKENSHDP